MQEATQIVNKILDELAALSDAEEDWVWPAYYIPEEHKEEFKRKWVALIEDAMSDYAANTRS